MILTSTYAVKESSLRMYNHLRCSYPHAPSVSSHFAVWQLTAPGRDLLQPTWARTPLAALEQLWHFWVFNQSWTVIF